MQFNFTGEKPHTTDANYKFCTKSVEEVVNLPKRLIINELCNSRKTSAVTYCTVLTVSKVTISRNICHEGSEFLPHIQHQIVHLWQR